MFGHNSKFHQQEGLKDWLAVGYTAVYWTTEKSFCNKEDAPDAS